VLSAKVPYFILDLLQQAPSVYVEGLGCFEAIFHPAVIDLPEARIKPPYVEPDFKYDLESPSEILPKYIAYAAGTQFGIAKGAIVAFVRRVYDQTEQGMLYPVEKFGTFSRSATGHIRFTPDWDAFNLSFSGLEVLDISPVVESTNGAQAYFPPPPVESWNEPVVRETFPTDNLVVDHKQIESVETTQETAADTATPHQNLIDQTTSRLWWIILTSAIVLIAILCAYLAWDIISNRQRLDELKSIYPDAASVIHNQDTVIHEDTAKIPVQNIPVTEVPETEVEPTPPPTTAKEETGSACYVVVGAFTEQVNVTRMVDRLVSLGYIAEQIQGGTLTRVAIRTNCDADNLQKVLNDARSSINPEAWIY
jgi:cell division septation protein DedD